MGTRRKAGIPPLSSKQTVDEILAEEIGAKIEQDNTMPQAMNVKIRLSHIVTGVPVEIDLLDSSPEELKEMIAYFTNNGYARPISSNQSKPDASGKTGKVTEVTKKEGKNQWDVTITLDEVGAGQVKLVAFAATAYRKNDRVRMTKNDKGFYEGTIINDEGANGERQTDIPF